MSPKGNKEERQPDLGGATDPAIEEHIREMMELEPSKDAKRAAATPSKSSSKSAKKVAITFAEPDAPEEVAEDVSEPEPDDAPGTPELPADNLVAETNDESQEATDDTLASDDTPDTAPELSEEGTETAIENEASEEDEVSEEAEPENVPEPEVESQPAKKQTPKEPFEDKATAVAVNDIIARESDDVLAVEDEKIAAAFDDKKPSFFGRIGGAWSAWWQSPLKRNLTILIIVAALANIAAWPQSRYLALNSVGVRSAANVRITDQSTKQPLRNVKVTINDSEVLTDADGTARFERLKLGTAKMSIEKRAFAEVTQDITIGWGSNPLGDLAIRPTGEQYSFKVTDYLSGKPVAKVEASSGDASAISDEDGLIRLTVEKADIAELEVKLSGDTYRNETLTFSADDQSIKELQMVPARKHLFVSKRSGKYDVYKVDVDGQNEEVIVEGTGSERDDIALVAHPNQEYAALVSTRESKRDTDGYLLSTLYIIDIKDGSFWPVATSERVQIVDWFSSRLAYVQVASGESAANPKRHRLMAYDFKEQVETELYATNYFNDVKSAGGKLFFAPSSTYMNAEAKLYSIEPSGDNRQTVFDREVWNIFRSAHDHLTLSTPGDWYDIFLGDGKVNKLNGQPANLVSKIYVDSPDKKRSLWSETRDGKGTLIAYDLASKEDTVLRAESGLRRPYRWLNDRVVIYRIGTEQETADYALSLDGGEPKKIQDVTDTSGLGTWYYY